MKSLFMLSTLSVFALSSCARNHVNDRKADYSQAIASPTGAPSADGSRGRMLFLRNCAHCHGPDAHGDEGPDLHGLNWTDEQIATRIRHGKKGQMTAFASKLPPEEIGQVILYLRTLK
jgi:mono/diheme cytochrome c family protein